MKSPPAAPVTVKVCDPRYLLDGVAKLRRRDRRVDLRLQRLYLQIGLLKLEGGLLEPLIGGLELLGGGFDLGILRFELLDLALERANFLAVALALLAHLTHLSPNFFQRGRGSRRRCRQRARALPIDNARHQVRTEMSRKFVRLA